MHLKCWRCWTSGHKWHRFDHFSHHFDLTFPFPVTTSKRERSKHSFHRVCLTARTCIVDMDQAYIFFTDTCKKANFSTSGRRQLCGRSAIDTDNCNIKYDLFHFYTTLPAKSSEHPCPLGCCLQHSSHAQSQRARTMRMGHLLHLPGPAVC